MALTAIETIHSKPVAADRRIQLVDTVIVPNSPQEVISGDAEILSITFVNYGGQANPKVTVTDGNGKAFMFYLATISLGYTVMFEKNEGTRCTGSMTWQCDTAAAVVGRVEYRRA